MPDGGGRPRGRERRRSGGRRAATRRRLGRGLSTPTVLTIGTTEVRGIVGIGLDQRILAARAVRARSIVAGVSAQDPAGGSSTALDASTIAAQFASIAGDVIDAVRIGALPSVAAIEAVAHALRACAAPIVLDPVRRSSRGAALAIEETLEATRERLVPLATIVTPNLREAEALTGHAVTTEAEMRAAGCRLVELGARAALVTGGHLAGDPVDLLVTSRSEPRRFAGRRIDREMRGTGCVLAVSLAIELARSRRRRPASDAELRRAVERARRAVRAAIAGAEFDGAQWIVSSRERTKTSR